MPLLPITLEKNPVAMELFPFAYKAAEYIRIMYSKEDGVLYPDNSLLDLDDGVSDVSRGLPTKIRSNSR